MNLKEIIHLQAQFDKSHKLNFAWDQTITQDNLEILQFLTIALIGEAGEFSNVVKKIIRGDRLLNESFDEISSEIADIFIYTLKLCYQLDIDLEQAFLKKLKENEIRFKKFEK